MTKEISLTQNKVALVDDEDYTELSKHKWFASKIGDKYYYAQRHSHKDPVTHKSTTIQMHSVILGTPKGMETDHINGNGLDNRRENLRVVTCRENQQNRHTSKSSIYPGVSWHERTHKWQARIRIKGKEKYIGLFEEESEAAKSYRIACSSEERDPE
jgi:hypothetical protein